MKFQGLKGWELLRSRRFLPKGYCASNAIERSKFVTCRSPFAQAWMDVSVRNLSQALIITLTADLN